MLSVMAGYMKGINNLFSFGLPLVALGFVIWQYTDMTTQRDCYKAGNECDAFPIPRTSILHGVRSRRIPNDKITEAERDVNGATGVWIEVNTVDVLKYEDAKLKIKQFTLYTKSPHNVAEKSSVDVESFNTACTTTGCLSDVRKMYARYSLGCYAKDTMAIDHTVSPACKCLEEFLGKITLADSDADAWPKSTDKNTDMYEATQYCSTRNENAYTVEYAGTLNTHGISINGLLFLTWGMICILGRQVTQKSDGPTSATGTSEVSMSFGSRMFYVMILQVGIFLTILSFTVFNVDHHTWDDKNPGHALMALRAKKDGETSYTTTGLGTLLEVTDAYSVETDRGKGMSTGPLLRSILWVALVVQTLVVALWTYLYIKSGYELYIPVLARVATDLPLIAGFTFQGVSVLVQNGFTNYSFLDYNVFVIVAICLLQHVSNVTKLFYDAVCRKTTTQTFIDLKTNDTGMTDDVVKKITTVLQFFGKIRIWIFLLVTVGCILLLTGTNELNKSLVLGNFTQSQVFVFALTLYLTNVSYDIVRELLPVQFENHDADSARFYIIAVYITFYVVNQYLYTTKMNE
jgi:hypothetical protein